ncbi:annexin [Pyxidicoccus trucidator]|uniref:annexin n=1 Tax=Pyxidicoccus trucidator TaxID=2709662 RepID=UPI0013DC53E8|nr:annexin [Pyxidicoccus trucidator]
MTSVTSNPSAIAAEIQRRAREAAEAAARQAAEAARRAAEAQAKLAEQAAQAQRAQQSTRSDFQAGVKTKGPELSADPTAPSSSLLTEDTRDGKSNCLDQAANWLELASPELRARSEMVFLADSRPGAEGESGHVVIRQGNSVFDPASRKSYASMDAYLKDQPHYQPAGTLRASAAKRIFDTPPGSPARAEALAKEKVSPELQRMMVADAARPPSESTTQPPPPGATQTAPPAGTQAPPAEQKPSYTQEQATKDAAALYQATDGGVTGFGTDEEKLFKTLQGKSPEQLDVLRKTYKDQYGKDLDKVIRKELSGADRKKADALLKGDGAKSDAVAIQAELDGVFGSSEEILKTLEKKSPEERHAIAEKYAELKGGAPAGQSPEDFMLSKLEKELDPDEMARARNLLGVSQAKTPEEATKLEAQALKDGLREDIGGAGTDEDRLFQRLEKATPEQRAILLQDEKLLKDLKGDLSKEDYARAMGLLQGNGAQADAARIRGAVNGTFGADEEAVRGVLEGKTPEQLEAIKAEYQKQTGKSLESEVRGWDGADKEVTLRLLNPPKEGDVKAQAEAAAERMHLAMDGAGTDEEKLRNELQGKSKTELDAIAAAYKEKYGKDLRKELDSELDGREQLELLEQMYDLGAVDPNDPNANQERVRRLREQQSQEKGFGTWVLDQTQRAIKGESDNDRLEHNLDRADTAIASGDTERATTLTGYATEDVKSLQASKDSLAEGAATAAVVVVTTAAVIATGGAATPLALAAYATLGAGTRAATYAAFQGGAAGAQELGRQALIGAAEGATAAIPVGKGAGALTSGARAGGTTVAKEAGTAGARTGATTGARTGATTGAKEAGTTGARTGATTGAKEAGTTATKEAAGSSVRQAAKQGVKEGAAGGVAGGAVDAATRSETWDNGVLSALGDIATRAVLDGTIGAVSGGLTGAGLTGTLKATGKAPTPGNKAQASEDGTQPTGGTPESSPARQSTTPGNEDAPAVAGSTGAGTPARAGPQGRAAEARADIDKALENVPPRLRTAVEERLAREPAAAATVRDIMTQPSWSRLTPSQREAMCEVIAETSAPALRDLRMLARDANRLTTPDSQGKTLVDNLKQLATQPLHASLARPGIGRREMLESVLSDVAAPQRVQQGWVNSCQVTALQRDMAAYDPSEYVRLMNGLTSTSGTVKMRGGAELTLEPTLFDRQKFALRNPHQTPHQERGAILRGQQRARPEDDMRSPSEGIFQSATLQHATGPEPYDARRGARLTSEGEWKEGLPSPSTGKLAEQLYGRPFRYVPSTDNNISLVERLVGRRGANTSPPYLVHVSSTPDGAGMGHVMSISRFENGRVYLSNPWGPTRMSVYDTNDPTRLVQRGSSFGPLKQENPGIGEWSIEVDQLQKYLKGITVPA